MPARPPDSFLESEKREENKGRRDGTSKRGKRKANVPGKQVCSCEETIERQKN